MSAKPWRLKELTYQHVLEMDRPFTVAALPFGSVEPHNYHLPYATDTIIAETVADMTCEAAWKKGGRPVLLPPMAYGTVPGMMDFPLAVDVKPTTHLAFLRDVVESLEAHGIFRLVVFNSHGSNEIKPMMRELYGKTKVRIFTLNCWNALPDLAEELFHESGHHAAELETSLCLAAFPELVRMEAAGDGSTNPSRIDALNRKLVWCVHPRRPYAESSGRGNPLNASAERGKQFLDAVADTMSDFLIDFEREELDESFPF